MEDPISPGIGFNASHDEFTTPLIGRWFDGVFLWTATQNPIRVRAAIFISLKATSLMPGIETFFSVLFYFFRNGISLFIMPPKREMELVWNEICVLL